VRSDPVFVVGRKTAPVKEIKSLSSTATAPVRAKSAAAAAVSKPVKKGIFDKLSKAHQPCTRTVCVCV